MGMLDGKVAVVTGAGRGIGRAHARLLAAEGARVVVNDLGTATAGDGTDTTPARQVVDEIVAAGGQAVANADNVATWNGAAALVQQAIDEFGRLDILVNNAGILRDAMSFNITEAEWDSVIEVHLKGHMAICHHAVKHWRALGKSGEDVSGQVFVVWGTRVHLMEGFSLVNTLDRGEGRWTPQELVDRKDELFAGRST